MSQRPNLILTGFMATGKTTVGRLAAAQLGYHFVDTDAEIEMEAKMTVREIFAQLGEEHFRQLERALAARLAAREGQVIATGGKLLLDPENAALLENSGKIFCLTASRATLLERLRSSSGEERPLLQGKSPEAALTRLLAEREPGYARFAPIATDGLSAPAVCHHLVKAFMD